MKQPTTYRLRNWNQYTNALKQRGSITFHFADQVTQRWLNPNKTGKPGASNTYSEQAIAACLSVKIVFGLPLRQAQGFVQSVLGLLSLDLPRPAHARLQHAVPTPEGLERPAAALPLPKRADPWGD